MKIDARATCFINLLKSLVAICTGEGSNGAAGKHITWKCVFPCKNCGGTEAGPRRDRGGTVGKCPVRAAMGLLASTKPGSAFSLAKTVAGPRRDRGGTEAGP